MNLGILPGPGGRAPRCMSELVATTFPCSLICDETVGNQHDTRVEVPALGEYCAEEKKS